MKRIFTISILILTTVLSLSGIAVAQLKTRKPTKKVAAKKSLPPTKVEPQSEAVEIVPQKTPVKRNERPETPEDETQNSPQEPQKKNQSPKTQSQSAAASQTAKNGFYYEFKQPNFVVSHIIIEHDETGKGTITFEKRDFGEPVTDPLQLSTAALEKIKNLFQTLNFVDSTENYQSTVRDYPHLGTMKIRLKQDGKERTAEYNWTENKDAKALTDEYRRVGEQFVWIFDMSVARENQPLETPSLMDRLDSLLRRNEISDPEQMLPLLKKLSNDERLPLIARNHATRMVKDIEKKSGK